MPGVFDSSKEYEISFWAKNDTNKAQVDVYYKAAAEFEKLYPNIHIALKLYTDYGKIYNDVITNISTGTTPNVCISYPDHIATYMTGDNVVLPLDALMLDEAYGLGGDRLLFDGPAYEELIPEFVDECRIGGVCYALPFMRSTEALYMNADYVQKLGYSIPDIPTWDWVFEVADAATRRNEDGTYYLNSSNVMIPLIYKSTDNMMISYLKQKGAGYSTQDGDILIFNDDTKDFLFTVREHTQKGAFSTFKISSYPGNFLNVGESVFGIDSTAGSTWMGTDAPNSDLKNQSAAKFRTEVRPIPQTDPEHPKMISQGPSVCIFNKEDSGEMLASWLFAQFLLSDEIQIDYAKTEGYVPVTSKARASSEYIDYLSRAGEDNSVYYDVKIAATKLLLDNTENTFVTPVFNGSSSLRDAAGQMIENVAKSVNRKQTVDDAYIEKLFSDMRSLYRLDSSGAALSANEAFSEPLPAGARALLICLGLSWIFIGIYFAFINIRRKK